MSTGPGSFLTFTTFNLVSLGLGYAARRRGWVHERHSRTIHFHTVVWVWSTAILLSLWRIPLQIENLWLLLIQPVVMTATAYAAIPVARWAGCDRAQVGVIAVAAGLSNTGFTMGSYLCYSLLKPADQALAYAIAYVPITTATTVMVLFPLARRYGPEGDRVVTVGRMMLDQFLDLRAMPMYAALAGVGLACVGVPYPNPVRVWGVLPILFYVGGFGGYFGIGLCLHVSQSTAYLKPYAALAGLKFVMMPILAVLLLGLIHRTPWPLGDLARRVVMIQAVMPTAILTVMVANLFHLDARIASAVWLWNTLLFLMIPLPVVLWLISSF